MVAFSVCWCLPAIAALCKDRRYRRPKVAFKDFNKPDLWWLGTLLAASSFAAVLTINLYLQTEQLTKRRFRPEGIRSLVRSIGHSMNFGTFRFRGATLPQDSVNLLAVLPKTINFTLAFGG
jgi:hypothetical protein